MKLIRTIIPEEGIVRVQFWATSVSKDYQHCLQKATLEDAINEVERLNASTNIFEHLYSPWELHVKTLKGKELIKTEVYGKEEDET